MAVSVKGEEEFFSRLGAAPGGGGAPIVKNCGQQWNQVHLPKPNVASYTQMLMQALGDSHDIPVSQFNFTKDEVSATPVASGCQAVVYAYRPQDKKKAKYAIKMLKEELAGDATQRECFAREIQVLGGLRHKHILTLKSFGETPAKLPFMIVDWVEANLTSALKLEHVGTSKATRDHVKRFYPNEARVRLMCQLAGAIGFLHSGSALKDCLVLHRDLKPDNIGLAQLGTCVKLMDFGLAVVLPKAAKMDCRYKLTGGTGSLRYMAPECANHEDYGAPVDVFSLSLVCWEVLALKGKPFYSLDEASHMRRVVLGPERPRLPSNWDKGLRNMLIRAWARDPDARITADEFSKALNNVAVRYDRRSRSKDSPSSTPPPIILSKDPLAMPSRAQRTLASMAKSLRRCSYDDHDNNKPKGTTTPSRIYKAAEDGRHHHETRVQRVVEGVSRTWCPSSGVRVRHERNHRTSSS
ncbi:hypothetical protein CTAYLR_004699 [Chrysophaeum taylorii]|uniref:Protein kinase domain-containing protein n=1 Tax=Chrysophaeum taylorii TaxID=2483200 RepID=A0AAD7U900_9STRA|nr:hypothetical protein CTAYLR_004699 [Chrysophaeum taylorii]